ncbi:hypothetical protein BTN50_0943 [Candidatus Enterovibrio altilux]|uniref:Uncharacterized protein n=1 Tax=Candidatus Enterovibrio altilux TaxID=1927128 RepID=A0A291B8W0_9GAMM|nr:hypothetical protein BTN50_0943 [Candidatus Enterovibrio luxaltus]
MHFVSSGDLTHVFAAIDELNSSCKMDAVNDLLSQSSLMNKLYSKVYG